jgi:predicted MFS family arabinose efflux permease
LPRRWSAAITLTLGWRTAFVVTGAVGFFWAALWYAFYGPPSEHTGAPYPSAKSDAVLMSLGVRCVGEGNPAVRARY